MVEHFVVQVLEHQTPDFVSCFHKRLSGVRNTEMAFLRVKSETFTGEACPQTPPLKACACSTPSNQMEFQNPTLC